MWRARRWRYLLNLIDHLPRNTYFSQAVSNDEEHTRLMLEAQERSGGDQAYHPPMAQWSQEAGMLADLIDEVRALRYVTTLAAGDGSSQPKPPVPYTRPQTAAEKVKQEIRERNHRDLAARMLGR